MSARSPDVLRRARDTARRWRQRSPAGAAREAIGCDRRADPPPRRLPPTPPGAQAEHAVLPGRALGYAAATSDERDIRKRLAASASAIGAWCHASVSWELVTVVHDTLRWQARGGGNRPALEYALAQIATGDAHVIVLARLRELTDSVAELGTLLRRLHDAGGYLVALDYGLDTSTEAGRLAARALIEVGDWERARILEQSRPGLAAARAKRQLDQHASEHDAAA